MKQVRLWRAGLGWILYDGSFKALRDRLGYSDITFLVQHPYEHFYVVEIATESFALVDSVSLAEAQEAGLDPMGKTRDPILLDEIQRLRWALRKLRADIHAADEVGDAEASAELQAHAEFVGMELGDRIAKRDVNADVELAHQSKARNVQRANADIRKVCPWVAEHLETFLETRSYFAYIPTPSQRIDWRDSPPEVLAD